MTDTAAREALRKLVRYNEWMRTEGGVCPADLIGAVNEAKAAFALLDVPFVPPPEADRADGYQCLGWYGDWVVIYWRKFTDISYWSTDDWRQVLPTSFAPLPAPPKVPT